MSDPGTQSIEEPEEIPSSPAGWRSRVASGDCGPAEVPAWQGAGDEMPEGWSGMAALWWFIQARQPDNLISPRGTLKAVEFSLDRLIKNKTSSRNIIAISPHEDVSRVWGVLKGDPDPDNPSQQTVADNGNIVSHRLHDGTFEGKKLTREEWMHLLHLNGDEPLLLSKWIGKLEAARDNPENATQQAMQEWLQTDAGEIYLSELNASLADNGDREISIVETFIEVVELPERPLAPSKPVPPEENGMESRLAYEEELAEYEVAKQAYHDQLEIYYGELAELVAEHGHGTLYLENPTFKSGDRYMNQFYWDIWFALQYVLEAAEEANKQGNELEAEAKMTLARGIADNFSYMLEHYGIIPNSNATYHLPRSQPPVFLHMLENIFRVAKKIDYGEPGEMELWLERRIQDVEHEYARWMADRSTSFGTMVRYGDDGSYPGQEVFDNENFEVAGILKTIFQREYDALMRVDSNGVPVWQQITWLPMELLFLGAIDDLVPIDPGGDGAGRTAGTDQSNEGGPMNAFMHRLAHAPLNAIMYGWEKRMEVMHRTLADFYLTVAEQKDEEAEEYQKKAEEHRQKEALWQRRGAVRLKEIQEYFWSEEEGLFLSVLDIPEFEPPTDDKKAQMMITEKKQLIYPSMMQFFLLYNEVATEEQAIRICERLLRPAILDNPTVLVKAMNADGEEEDLMKVYDFENGGLLTEHGPMHSQIQWGTQWDAPWQWPNMTWLAIASLDKYAKKSQDSQRQAYFEEKADELTILYLRHAMNILHEYKTLPERTNVMTGTAEGEIDFGYNWNNHSQAPFIFSTVTLNVVAHAMEQGLEIDGVEPSKLEELHERMIQDRNYARRNRLEVEGQIPCP